MCANELVQVWGACAKLTQYKILHHFLVELHAISYIVAIYLYCCNMCYILAIYVYCCNLCKLLQFIYIAKKTLNRLLISHGDMLTKTVSVALSLFP